MKLCIPEPTPPIIIEPSLFSTADIAIDALLGAPKARSSFDLNGSGLAVAVLDTGLRVTHKCFSGRVPESRNFTRENGGDPGNVTDRNGHGTNVAGLIAGGTNDERRGIAPGAMVVPLKVLPAPTLAPIVSAMGWINENHARLNISVAVLALGTPGINLTNDAPARTHLPQLAALLKDLTAKRVAVVAAAGNDYKDFETEGLSVPAIFREVISVGAVYDASVGTRRYSGGATAFSTHAGQMTPFTQRLSRAASEDCYMDVLAAGTSAVSAGSTEDDATSVQDGMSQAAPTVAGVVLLMQQHFKRLTGSLPPIELLQDALRSTSSWIVDDEDVDDNVAHTSRRFPRVDAFESIVALDKFVKLAALQRMTP